MRYIVVQRVVAYSEGRTRIERTWKQLRIVNVMLQDFEETLWEIIYLSRLFDGFLSYQG